MIWWINHPSRILDIWCRKQWPKLNIKSFNIKIKVGGFFVVFRFASYRILNQFEWFLNTHWFKYMRICFINRFTHNKANNIQKNVVLVIFIINYKAFETILSKSTDFSTQIYSNMLEKINIFEQNKNCCWR